MMYDSEALSSYIATRQRRLDDETPVDSASSNSKPALRWRYSDVEKPAKGGELRRR